MNEIRTIKSAAIVVERAEDGRPFFKLPDGFELPEGKLQIRQDGERLIVEAEKKKQSLRELLDSWGPLTHEEWPDIDDSDLGPLRDVKL